MARKVQFVVAVFAFAALLGSASAQENPERPIKMEAVGTLTPPTVISFAPLTVYVVGTGTAEVSHLGASQFVFPQYFFPLSGTFSGDLTITAANGDLLIAHVTGRASPTGVPGVNAIQEDAVFIGGTGRFENATGTAVLTGVVDTVARTVTVTGEGTVSY